MQNHSSKLQKVSKKKFSFNRANMWWWIVYKYIDLKRKEKCIQIHFWWFLSTLLIGIYRYCWIFPSYSFLLFPTLPMVILQTKKRLRKTLSGNGVHWMFTFCQVVKKWTFLTTSIHSIGKDNIWFSFAPLYAIWKDNIYYEIRIIYGFSIFTS